MPNARYPITQDPVGYALLSSSLWETGTYQILGQPDDVFVPMLPILSYPAIAIFGLSLGMKVMSLVAGILFAVSIFVFLRTYARDNRWLAYGTLLLLPAIPFVTWLLSVGNADLLYGALFFLCLTIYVHAEKRPGLYPLLGMLIGMTMLTRYMGVALLPIVTLDALIHRRRHLRHPLFLSLFPIALGVFSLWFLRHKITFGTWFSTFHVSYTVSDQSPLLPRVLRNALYYANPVHSVLFLTPFTLVGLWFSARKYLLLTLAIPLSLLLCYVYPSLTTRFLIATTPLLLAFTALGIARAWKLFPTALVTVYFLGAGLAHAGLTCFYALPACNAALDRLELPFIPANAHLTQERLASMQEAIDWVNAHAERDMTVIAMIVQREDLPVWRDAKLLRTDLTLALRPGCEHATYEINARESVAPEIPILYETRTEPKNVVRVILPEDCRRPLGRDPEQRYWH